MDITQSILSNFSPDDVNDILTKAWPIKLFNVYFVLKFLNAQFSYDCVTIPYAKLFLTSVTMVSIATYIQL